jgi:hypothetical protein
MLCRPEVVVLGLMVVAELSAERIPAGHYRGRRVGRAAELRGDNPAGLAAEIRKLTAGAFKLLDQGRHDYAVKPAQAADRAG